MKKIITISAISFIVFVFPSFVVAQNIQQGQRGVNQQGSQATIQPGNVAVSPQATQQQEEVVNRGIEKAVQKLNRVATRNNNPEIGQQVRSMVENHQQVQENTQTALEQMSQRGQALKFLIGPDYKNAGQLRSNVVGLRNDIRKLEQIKDKSLPTDLEDLQGAIDDLQTEADGIETQLTEQLEGFSLFGWLAKLLAN